MIHATQNNRFLEPHEFLRLGWCCGYYLALGNSSCRWFCSIGRIRLDWFLFNLPFIIFDAATSSNRRLDRRYVYICLPFDIAAVFGLFLLRPSLLLQGGKVPTDRCKRQVFVLDNEILAIDPVPSQALQERSIMDSSDPPAWQPRGSSTGGQEHIQLKYTKGH